MVTRVLALFGLIFVISMAHAQSSLIGFEWKRDSRFEIQFNYNGVPTSLKGNLAENSEVEMAENGFTLKLKAYPEGFVYAVVTHQSDDNGLVFLIERHMDLSQRKDMAEFFVSMLPSPITGRKSTIVADMTGILDALKKLNGWDVAITMRAMVEFFGANPEIQLSGFYDAVEAGQINQIPKPNISPDVVEDGVVQPPVLEERRPQQKVEPLPEPQPEPLAPSVEVPLAPFDPDADLGQNEDPSSPQQFVPVDMTAGWDGDE